MKLWGLVLVSLTSCVNEGGLDSIAQEGSTPRARLAIDALSSSVAQRNTAWNLSQSGSVDRATSQVTWSIVATPGLIPHATIFVAGRIKVHNAGHADAPIGNAIINLQTKSGSNWTTRATDIVNTTLGDAATTAKVVPDKSQTVANVAETLASGHVTLTSASGTLPANLVLPSGASVWIDFMATYDNAVLGLTPGTKVRAELAVTYGVAGKGTNTAANADIDGSGTVEADEARVGTTWVQFTDKSLPALTTSPAVSITETASDVTKTGTVTTGATTFNLGSTSGTVKVAYDAGATGGTITNCAHLVGDGINQTACDTQTIIPGWHVGDFVTRTQSDWITTDGAALVTDNFNSVYMSGVLVVGTGFSITLSNSSAPVTLMQSSGGTAAALTANELNPTTTSSGPLGGELVALALNVDFSDAGVTPRAGTLRFGDVRVCGVGGFSGMTVRDVLAAGEAVLGGGAGSPGDVFAIAENLNAAFGGGDVGPFANDHLQRGATCQ